jgi:hypothetical protein
MPDGWETYTPTVEMGDNSIPYADFTAVGDRVGRYKVLNGLVWVDFRGTFTEATVFNGVIRVSLPFRVDSSAATPGGGGVFNARYVPNGSGGAWRSFKAGAAGVALPLVYLSVDAQEGRISFSNLSIAAGGGIHFNGCYIPAGII